MERLREVTPDKVLAVLGENYGKPVSGDKISEVVWGTNLRVSDHYIRVLMMRCRLFFEDRFVDGKSALYSLYSIRVIC